MNNFLKRSITGLVLVGFILTCIWTGPFGFIFLSLLINGAALFEFYRLVERRNIRINKTLSITLSSSILISIFLITAHISDWRIISVVIPLMAILFIVELYLNEESPFQNLAYTILGLSWVTVSMLFFIMIPYLPMGKGSYNPNMALGYFIILWASDTGAYITGSILGKKKLFERISPKKTWEGSVGGALLATSASILIANRFDELSFLYWIIVAGLVTVFGTYGDLLKSKLKRSVNIKDSGNLLPGHGGFLDRFDSLMGSAPFVFSFLLIAMKPEG